MKHESFRGLNDIDFFFLIIKCKQLHHEKVTVSFQGLTLKSLEWTYRSFQLWNMDSTWFGHHLFYLQNDCPQSGWECVSQKDTCPGNKWAEQHPDFWKLFGLNHQDIHYNCVNGSSPHKTSNGGQADGTRLSRHLKKEKQSFNGTLDFLCTFLLLMSVKLSRSMPNTQTLTKKAQTWNTRGNSDNTLHPRWTNRTTNSESFSRVHSWRDTGADTPIRPPVFESPMLKTHPILISSHLTCLYSRSSARAYPFLITAINLSLHSCEINHFSDTLLFFLVFAPCG